jgi:bifunctional UDP-N-acetylglucosamine pyrophosphorylase/glucosamine-1-phosphate N-acetyltransferase
MNQDNFSKQGALPVSVVVMAAGKGTRMKSERPKVLHRIAGRAMLSHVLATVEPLAAANALQKVVVVTGHGAEAVEAHLSESPLQAQHLLEFARQMPQLGTGHAVQQALPHLPDSGVVVILNGDVPLIQADTIQALIQASAGQNLALLTVQLADPTGYGRIVRKNMGSVQAIVEHKDATIEQRAIQEIYTGIMAAPAQWLKRAVSQLQNNNSQGEFYLTDIVAMAVAEGLPVVGQPTTDEVQVAGVNSPVQLAELERAFQQRLARHFMEAGVRLADPARFDVRGDLQCGSDVEIDVNCVFEGQVRLGHRVRIGANCFIANVQIADDAVIHPFTHIDGEKPGVVVGEGALVGPFARLRPGAVLGAEVHIGNFVEVKNSTMAKGSKANHLAYLGDATVGERVNYGAGSITANYDGANKHRTVIEADVHVGSNSVLVAPVTLGAGGTVGAGSVVSKDTPPGALTVTRARQTSLANWSRPIKPSSVRTKK